jgi:hypothetical protein
MAYDNLALDPDSRNVRRRLCEKRAELRLTVRRAKRKWQEVIALDTSVKQGVQRKSKRSMGGDKNDRSQLHRTPQKTNHDADEET